MDRQKFPSSILLTTLVLSTVVLQSFHTELLQSSLVPELIYRYPESGDISLCVHCAGAEHWLNDACLGDKHQSQQDVVVVSCELQMDYGF